MLEVDSQVIQPEELVARVRARLGHSPVRSAPAVPTQPSDAGKDLSLLEENVRQLHANWNCGASPHISSHRRLVGPALVFGKKIVRKLLKWYVDARWNAQTNFNGSVTRAVSDLMRLSKTAHSERQALGQRLSGLQAEQEASKQAYEGLLEAQAESQRQALDALRAEFAAQLDTVRQEGRQAVEAVEEQHAHAQKALTALREENHLLAMRVRKLRQGLAEPSQQAPTAVAAEAPSEGGIEIDYLLFENRFRGSREEILPRMAHYLDHFTDCFDGRGRVLDIGCGRGEMVELLLGKGCDVLGIDLDADMAEFCQERGLPVLKGDGLAHLDACEDNSLGGIFLSQVIEHLTTPQWGALLDTARRKLRPNGVLVMETIHPGSFFALANAFYKDLTHVRPVHPETLQFVAESKGYRAEILLLSPHPLRNGPDRDPVTQALAETVFGYQDYALIARK